MFLNDSDGGDRKGKIGKGGGRGRGESEKKLKQDSCIVGDQELMCFRAVLTKSDCFFRCSIFCGYKIKSLL